MKLKGKAIFELTNVDTGETRVVKEENMVTNAFQYLIQETGLYGTVMLDRALGSSTTYSDMDTAMSKTSYNRDMVRSLTNGLVLFNGKLNESVDHVYITADDPGVTGVGADLAYIGEQTCAGSYNKTESGVIEKGYKHVWDFTTSQANGDIGCACLTSVEGAGLGFGLPTYVADWKGKFTYLPTEYNKYIYMPKFDDYVTAADGTGCGVYVDEERNIVIRIKDYFSIPNINGSTYTSYVTNEPDINGNIVSKQTFDKTFIYKKSIDLNIYRCPFNNISIFDDKNLYYTSSSIKYQGSSVTSVSYGDKDVLETITVNMPSGLAALIPDDIVQTSINSNYYWPTAVNTDEGFMYISFIIPTVSGTNGAKLESGDKVYTWKINMNTFESTWFAITNTTGETVSAHYNSSFFSRNPFVTVTNNYTVLYKDNYNKGYAWIIDNATGSTVKQVVNYDGDAFSFTTTPSGVATYSDLVYYFYPGTMHVLNLKTGIMTYAVEAGYVISESSNYKYMAGVTHGTKLPKFIGRYNYTYGSSSGVSYLTLYVNPQLLMTINNLEETVTKTSAETMKVTYIITQETEE